MKNPPILLLDEATSALDTRTEQDILATLHARFHRPHLRSALRTGSTIADADTILVLNDGALAERAATPTCYAAGALRRNVGAAGRGDGGGQPGGGVILKP